MSAGQPRKWSKSSKVVVAVISLLSVAFAIGLGVLLFFMLRPRGEKVGVVSLTEPQAVLIVNGKSGDTLAFRVDASVGVPRISLLDDEQLERKASAQLRTSLLTVRATGPSGNERSASCSVYKGRAMTTTTTSGTLARSGMLTDCVIVLDEPGVWKIRGTVAWASDLTLRSAELETRLEPRAR